MYREVESHPAPTNRLPSVQTSIVDVSLEQLERVHHSIDRLMVVLGMTQEPSDPKPEAVPQTALHETQRRISGAAERLERIVDRLQA